MNTAYIETFILAEDVFHRIHFSRSLVPQFVSSSAETEEIMDTLDSACDFWMSSMQALTIANGDDARTISYMARPYLSLDSAINADHIEKTQFDVLYSFFGDELILTDMLIFDDGNDDDGNEEL